MTDASNPFLDYSDQRRRPTRVKVVRSDADAPMKPSAMEKDQRDKSTQMRSYREYWREQRAKFRSGHYTLAIMLERFLRKMTIDDGDALIDLVKRHKMSSADRYTRQVMLHIIAERIEQLRVQNGLAPFDDSIPGEEPTVFEIVRAELNVP